jgi:hypothetical protein
VEVAAIEKRAGVLMQHFCNAWMVVRNLTYESIIDQDRDMEKGRPARVIADALKVIQGGERKAWGVNSDEKRPVAMQVIVNRRAGTMIGQ